MQVEAHGEVFEVFQGSLSHIALRDMPRFGICPPLLLGAPLGSSSWELLKASGGPKSPTNYNKINSPGTSYLKNQIPEEHASRFANWVRDNVDWLRQETRPAVADRIGEELLRIDGQLGVEVGDDRFGTREVIVTAFSDPRLFPLVERIVELLSGVPGFRFIALKPPRGFRFRLTVGAHQIDVSSFRFSPISGIDAGIQLVPPAEIRGFLPNGAKAEEMAWLVVESGVGERLAGRLQHVEFSSGDDSGEGRPIAELEEYLKEIAAQEN